LESVLINSLFRLVESDVSAGRERCQCWPRAVSVLIELALRWSRAMSGRVELAHRWSSAVSGLVELAPHWSSAMSGLAELALRWSSAVPVLNLVSVETVVHRGAFTTVTRNGYWRECASENGVATDTRARGRNDQTHCATGSFQS
jgi:hypothetical protein